MNGNYNSETTPIKQEIFERLLNHHLNVCFNIFSNPKTQNKIYQYLDIFAGPGMCNEELPGSPLIFKKVIQEYKIDYTAQFFELCKKTCSIT